MPTEARGESMVQKHREKLQREKEAAMLAVLKPLVPVPESALRLAAEEAGWELEPTVALLKLFQAACAAQLQQLAQVRMTLGYRVTFCVHARAACDHCMLRRPRRPAARAASPRTAPASASAPRASTSTRAAARTASASAASGPSRSQSRS